MGWWSITFGMALRLTRFIVVDDLGRWTVKGPYQRHAVEVEAEAIRRETSRINHAANEGHRARLVARHADAVTGRRPYTTAQKISHGLECPYCVGTWVGIGTFALAAVASRHDTSKRMFAIVASGLTASFLSGAIINHLDPEEE